MKQVAFALALGLIAMGAGQAPVLPVPPIPPVQPPTDQLAPVPDVDVRAPAELGPQGMQFSVNDFRVRRFETSLGYARGSHFQTSEEKRPIQTPGVTLKVPLQ